MVIHRNWLDLPQDVTLTIMKKLDVSVKLKSIQFVCKMWYTLCKEPSLWQTLRIHGLEEPEGPEFSDCEDEDRKISYASDIKMMYSAIDRSNGGLIELHVEGFCTPELLSYALSRSSQLKRLRLARCDRILYSVKELKEELEKLSSLEQLVLTFSFIPYGMKEKIIPIISSCSSLTGFGLNRRRSYEACDDEALAIAAGMPNLRHLQLLGNNMTNVGLTAILDGCPLLQSLDLRGCFQLDLAGNLGKSLVETMEYYDDYDDIPEAFIVYESDFEISYNNDFNDGF